MSSFLLDEEFLKNEDMDRDEMEELIGPNFDDFKAGLGQKTGFDSDAPSESLPKGFEMVDEDEILTGDLMEGVSQEDVESMETEINPANPNQPVDDELDTVGRYLEEKQDEYEDYLDAVRQGERMLKRFGGRMDRDTVELQRNVDRAKSKVTTYQTMMAYKKKLEKGEVEKPVGIKPSDLTESDDQMLQLQQHLEGAFNMKAVQDRVDAQLEPYGKENLEQMKFYKPEAYQELIEPVQREAQDSMKPQVKQSRLEGNYSFIRTFNSEKDITKKKNSKDGLMDAVTNSTRDYVTKMDNIKTEGGAIDEDAVTDLVNTDGNQVIKACGDYIAAKNPILPWGIGKRRKKLVVKLKEEMEKLNPTIEKNVYGYLGRDRGLDNVEQRDVQDSKKSSEDILTGLIIKDEGESLSIDEILMMISNGLGGVIDQARADAFRVKNRNHFTNQTGDQGKDADREKKQKEQRPLKDEEQADEKTKKTMESNPTSTNSSLMVSPSDKQNQNKFYTLAQRMGVSDAMPVEFDQETDEMKEKSILHMQDYDEITDGRRMDEIPMTPEAKTQLALVKTLGFIVGVPNWDNLVAPENLLYEQDDTGQGIKSIMIQQLPEMGVDIGKMTRQDAEKFVKQFDNEDAKSMSTVERMLKNPKVMKGLGDILGVSTERLVQRIKLMIMCISLYRTVGSLTPIPESMFDQ